MKIISFLFFALNLTMALGQQAADSTSKKTTVLRLGHGLASTHYFQVGRGYWNSHFNQLQIPNSTDSVSFHEVTQGLNTDISINFSAEFQLQEFKKKGKLFIQGNIGTGPVIDIGGSYSNAQNMGIFDTLYSSLQQSYQYVYLQKFETYRVTKRVRTVQLGTGITYSTNLDRVLAFSTGFLVNYSFGFVNGLTATNLTTYTTTDGYSNNTNAFDYSSSLPQSQPKEESIETHKMINNLQFQVPISLSFRLGRKPNLAGRMRLGIDTAPGVYMSFYDGVIRSNFAISNHLSLRFIL